MSELIMFELHKRKNELENYLNEAMTKGDADKAIECKYRLAEVERLMNIIVLSE